MLYTSIAMADGCCSNSFWRLLSSFIVRLADIDTSLLHDAGDEASGYGTTSLTDVKSLSLLDSKWV